MRPIAAIVIFAYALVWFHQAGHGELGVFAEQRVHVHAAHANPFELDHTLASHEHEHHAHDHHDHHHGEGHDHSGAHHCEDSHDHHHYSHEHFSMISLAPNGKQTGKIMQASTALLPSSPINGASITLVCGASLLSRNAHASHTPKYLTHLSLRI